MPARDFTSHRAVFGKDVHADGISPELAGRRKRGARTDERVEHRVALVGQQLDEPFGKREGERGAVIFVSAFRREMQDVARIGFVTANPVRDIFPETASHLGIVADGVVFPQ